MTRITGQVSATAITELDDRSDRPVFELDASAIVLVRLLIAEELTDLWVSSCRIRL